MLFFFFTDLNRDKKKCWGEVGCLTSALNSIITLLEDIDWLGQTLTLHVKECVHQHLDGRTNTYYSTWIIHSSQCSLGRGGHSNTQRDSQRDSHSLTHTHTHIWHWLRLTDWPMATDQFKSKNKKKRGMVLTTKEKRHGLSAPRPSEICFLCCYI